MVFALKNNPLLSLSLLFGCVLLWKNYKKVLFTSGRLLWLILSLVIHLLHAAALVLTIVASAIGAGSSNKFMHFAAFVSEVVNIHWLPHIYHVVKRYGLYIIPHFLFSLRRPFAFGVKVIPDSAICLGCIDSEVTSPFEMPAPILLQ